MPTGIRSCHLPLDLSKACHVHKIKIRAWKNNDSWEKAMNVWQVCYPDRLSEVLFDRPNILPGKKPLSYNLTKCIWESFKKEILNDCHFYFKWLVCLPKTPKVLFPNF